MKVYIVRHGETYWNLEGRMQGIENSSLTEEGIREAKVLGERLKNEEFVRVYTSPLGRCLETTLHIIDGRKLEVHLMRDIQEFNFGILEGKTRKYIEDNYPEKNDKLWNGPEEYDTESGETFEELFERVEKSFEEITRNNKMGNVLVITHGIYINALFTYLKDRGIKEIWEIPMVDNTSLSIVEVKDGDARILSKNDISHL